MSLTFVNEIGMGTGAEFSPTGCTVKSTFKIAAVACGVSSLFFAATADAAGLYFSDRGVRPMGRAGAFVAGADDLGAIWYNPAGIADCGTSFLADFSWLHF